MILNALLDILTFFKRHACFIIIHHLMLRGLGLRGLEDASFENKYIIYAVLNCFIIIAVNGFFLISGYFSIKFKIEKIVKLIIATYTLYWMTTIICTMCGGFSIDADLMKSMIFPISKYWFLLVYIILACVAPALNTSMAYMDKKTAKGVIISLLLVYCGYAFLIDHSAIGANMGYSLSYAVVLYLVGAYIKRYPIVENIAPPKALLAYVLTSVILSILVVLAIKDLRYDMAWILYSYNNPLVMLGSIFFFLAFKELKVSCPGISRLGRYTLYVYIFHSAPIVSRISNEIFIKLRAQEVTTNIVILTIMAIILYTIGVFCGYLFESCYTLVLKRLNNENTLS